jgi:hypothetical protein
VVREEKDDPATEHRIPCPAGALFLVDSERLWHAVWHDRDKYSEPRYAVIASFESGPQLESWVQSQLP